MPIEMPRGLPFSVDTWSPSSKGKKYHFLTHAHKDHCSGITSNSSYPIYSTRLTKLLVLQFYPQLDESLFVCIEVGQSIQIDDPDGNFAVTAFDANHCPGAVMLLFEGSFGNILHTGDCRLTPECLQNLPEKYLGKKNQKPKCQLDYIFLDCTFGKTPFRIPSTHSATQEVVKCIWRHPKAPRVYLTCDLLGQEQLLVKVFQTFGTKIYVDKAKNPECHQTLALLVPEILSDDPSSRFLLFDGFPKLYERAQKKISEARERMQPEPLIIRPSAQWYACQETELTVTERKKIEKSNEAVRDQFGIWHVCYSMHSSKQELEWALQLLAPRWVVSTTPECRAMELEYVKKHCFGTQLTSDDPLWKLLNICVDAPSQAAVVVEEEKCISVVEECDVSSGQSELQLLKISPGKKCCSNESPWTERSLPITLFGRARLGYEFCKFYEEKKSTAINCNPEDVLSNGAEQNPFLCEDESEVKTKKLSDDSREVEAAERQVCESKGGELGSCRTTSHIPISSPKGFSDNFRKLYGSGIVPVQRPLIISDSPEGVFRNGAEQNPLPCKDNSEVRTEKLCDNSREVEAAEKQIGESIIRDSQSWRTTSHISISSPKGFDDNFRKFYRSGNVPVPRPLPSLMELMRSRKRAKMFF